MWILIIWMFGAYGNPTITTQEFQTESACRAAFAEAKKGKQCRRFSTWRMHAQG